MKTAIISTDNVGNYLNTLGDTGTARVRDGGLYLRTEENARELYAGEVIDVEGVKAAIVEYFDR